MQRTILIFLLFFILSAGGMVGSNDRLIFDRIGYIFHLKQLIGQQVWQDFADPKFDLPLIYYTDSACYVANPTERFISNFRPELVFEEAALKIYKTPLLDSIPFHMETNITMGDSSADYNYYSPFMNCSSFEITQKTIPDVNSTEQWTSMILHEYFHGFQFKHPDFLAYFEKHIAGIPADSLKRMYQSHQWYKERVDKENELLLAALEEEDENEIRRLIQSFFRLRTQRRLQSRQQLNFDLQPVEKTFETMEGTARYVEYALYSYFAQKEADEKLMKSDTAYHSYAYFRNHRLEQDKWLYLTDKTTYFYATGFNLLRLLDKLKIDYQSRLFLEGELSLEDLLEQYLVAEAGK